MASVWGFHEVRVPLSLRSPMPFSAKYKVSNDEWKHAHISEVDCFPKTQDWYCVSCQGTMFTRCLGDSINHIQAHFVHKRDTNCTGSVESDTHILVKRWVCRNWENIMSHSCSVCDRPYLPDALVGCLADTEMRWHWQLRRYVADVGIADASGTVKGCIEVVHTHTNTDMKEVAIQDAKIEYAEIHTKDVQCITTVHSPWNEKYYVKISKRMPSKGYCSNGCKNIQQRLCIESQEASARKQVDIQRQKDIDELSLFLEGQVAREQVYTERKRAALALTQDILKTQQQVFDSSSRYGPRSGITRQERLMRHIRYKGLDTVTQMLQTTTASWLHKRYNI